MVFSVVQVKVGGRDLLAGDTGFDPVELVEQGGDLPGLGADVDVVEAEAEEDGVGKVGAPLVVEFFCHVWCVCVCV